MWTEHHLLTLLQIKGVGKRTVQRLVASTRPPEDDAGLVDLAVRKQLGTSSRVVREDVEEALAAARSILSSAEALQIKAIGMESDAYPRELSRSPDPPILLWVRGDPDILENPTVAVVGTREPTEEGRTRARRVAQHLVDEGFTIVSGLALGCDAEAQAGALARGGLTIGVLAHGLEEIRPKANQELGLRILEKGGALVSEYAPTTKPRPSHFVARNRIQVGLSWGVIVVETGISGGSMHTVRFCREAGKPLGVMSYPSTGESVPKREGNQELLQHSSVQALDTPESIRMFTNRLTAEHASDKGRPADHE